MRYKIIYPKNKERKKKDKRNRNILENDYILPYIKHTVNGKCYFLICGYNTRLVKSKYTCPYVDVFFLYVCIKWMLAWFQHFYHWYCKSMQYIMISICIYTNIDTFFILYVHTEFILHSSNAHGQLEIPFRIHTHTHWIGRPAYFVADNCSRILVYGARLQPTAPPPPHNKEKLLKWCSLLRWKDNLTLSKKLASGRHNAAGVFFFNTILCSSNSRIEMEKFSFYFELNFHLSENFLVWKFYKDIYML